MKTGTSSILNIVYFESEAQLNLVSFLIELQDISLFLAINALILLVTLEMLSSQPGKGKIQVNWRRLRIAAITVSILFLVSVILRIVVSILAT